MEEAEINENRGVAVIGKKDMMTADKDKKTKCEARSLLPSKEKLTGD